MPNKNNNLDALRELALKGSTKKKPRDLYQILQEFKSPIKPYIDSLRDGMCKEIEPSAVALAVASTFSCVANYRYITTYPNGEELPLVFHTVIEISSSGGKTVLLKRIFDVDSAFIKNKPENFYFQKGTDHTHESLGKFLTTNGGVGQTVTDESGPFTQLFDDNHFKYDIPLHSFVGSRFSDSRITRASSEFWARHQMCFLVQNYAIDQLLYIEGKKRPGLSPRFAMIRNDKNEAKKYLAMNDIEAMKGWKKYKKILNQFIEDIIPGYVLDNDEIYAGCMVIKSNYELFSKLSKELIDLKDEVRDRNDDSYANGVLGKVMEFSSKFAAIFFLLELVLEEKSKKVKIGKNKSKYMKEKKLEITERHIKMGIEAATYLCFSHLQLANEAGLLDDKQISVFLMYMKKYLSNKNKVTLEEIQGNKRIRSILLSTRVKKRVTKIKQGMEILEAQRLVKEISNNTWVWTG